MTIYTIKKKHQDLTPVIGCNVQKALQEDLILQDIDAFTQGKDHITVNGKDAKNNLFKEAH